jgi:hypothetical protein
LEEAGNIQQHDARMINRKSPDSNQQRLRAGKWSGRTTGSQFLVYRSAHLRIVGVRSGDENKNAATLHRGI